MEMEMLYLSKKIYMVAIILVLIGSLNWGLIGLFDLNIVKSLFRLIRLRTLERFVYVIVGLAGVMLMFSRDTYLPFLGDCVFPCPTLENKTPAHASVSRTFKIKNGANKKVVYWASEPSQSVFDNPWDAYGDYSNFGVTVADNHGNVEVKVREPSEYKVPSGKQLKRHIHYRYCKAPGMLSSVHTVFI
jgi:uncharacterized membrane protein YuzA (DUF378 family)